MEADDFVSSSAGVLELAAGWERTSDVGEFEAACARARRSRDPNDAARAADLYGGDLLPENPDDPWLEADRARLRGAHLQMLRAAGRWTTVAELDPWDEAAHRALMREALHSGNRAGALQIFEGLRVRLREDLGIGPSAATQRLAADIRLIEQPSALVAEEVRSLIARGRLGYWGRTGLDEVAQVASRARELALDAGLSTEVGEASTLLSTVGVYTGTWWERFRADFRFALTQPRPSAVSVFDALTCYAEFVLDAPGGARNAALASHEALDLVRAMPSEEGEALARLMHGEAQLVSGRLEEAQRELEAGYRAAERSGWLTAQSLVLQRLAEMHLATGDRTTAARLAQRAVATARHSDMVSHVLVRSLSAMLRTAADPDAALTEAERVLRATSSCEPCGMGYLFAAIEAAAEVGRISDARVFLEDAERLWGLWGGGPWQGALWFARGRIREAEGEDAIARVFYEEAARSYAAEDRPLEEARCRAAATLRD